MTSNLLDLDLLDDDDPFEITSQIAHLYKRGPLGVDDVLDDVAQRPAVLPGQARGALADGRTRQRHGAGGPSRPLSPVTRPSAGPSAAMSPQPTWQPATWKTDEPSRDDPRTGTRVLQQA